MKTYNYDDAMKTYLVKRKNLKHKQKLLFIAAFFLMFLMWVITYVLTSTYLELQGKSLHNIYAWVQFNDFKSSLLISTMLAIACILFAVVIALFKK